MRRAANHGFIRATVPALGLILAFVLSGKASSDPLRVAMDNMMQSQQPAASAPSQSGGTGMGTMGDNMSNPSQGAMGSSSSGGGMMDDKMKQMMREHMQGMTPGGVPNTNSQPQVGPGGMPGMASGSGHVDLTSRIEGRIAFLKAELQVTEGQAPIWNKFADALRSGRSHLLLARTYLSGAEGTGTGAERLEQYERHLGERFEALRSARGAFMQLYSSLNEAQKRTADELVVPFIEAF